MAPCCWYVRCAQGALCGALTPCRGTLRPMSPLTPCLSLSVVVSVLQRGKMPRSGCGGSPKAGCRTHCGSPRLCCKVSAVQGHSSSTGCPWVSRQSRTGRGVWWRPRPSASTPLSLPGHTEKIYSIRFHPVAADLLVSSSYDMTVRIWELGTGQEVLCLQGHTDQVGSGGAGGPQHPDVPGLHAAAQLGASSELVPKLRC